MAPALTKVLKEGHGIHLSSPLSSGRVDSNGRAVCRTELEPARKSTEDADPQTLWLNFSLFPSLESWLATGPLNVPADPLPSPHLQTSAAQCESVLPSSSASLLGLLSMNGEELGASHQGVPVLPGAPDTSLGPVSKHNSQQTCQLHGPDTAHECEPDGGDVHRSPFPLTSFSPSCSLGEIRSLGCTSSFAHGTQTPIEEKAVRVGCVPSAPLQPCSGRLNFDQLALIALLEEELQSWQTGLHSQAWRQRAPCFPSFDSSTVSSYFRELSCSSQAVPGGLQEASDSEATASSSSDDELEEKKSSPTGGSSSGSSSCERRWLGERAELSSRWTWLQLRLSELEGRIQQLVELHKHIRSSKGGVVLGPAQPQIQQVQLEKMTKFSCSDSDADAETCSPTRLLHNIARQSAQVSSLIPPLSFSPPSKQAQTCTVSRTFTSGMRGGDVSVPGSLKRKRLLMTKMSKTDASWCCARTRPLLTYYKPKLFSFNCNPGSPQGGDKSASSLPPSPSCSGCSSCVPADLCSDPSCSSSLALSSRKPGPHPVLSRPFDTHLVHHFQRTPAREEWSLTPLIINAQSPTHAHHTRCRSTPLANSCSYRHNERYKHRAIGLSPVRMSASALSEHRRASRRKRKRRPVRRSIKDEDDVLEQPCELKDCSYKGSVRKSPFESVYSSDNIVIRLSVSRVEQLQYKDILTPRWRVLSTRCLTENQAGDDEVEDLSDEVFARRHEALEQSEKLRWSSWGKRKCSRRPTRCGSRMSGCGAERCTSAEESSSSVERAGAQLGADEQLRSGEWLPRTPWEPRAFPLDEDEEEALLCDRVENVASGWSQSSSGSFRLKDSNSHLSPPQASGAILPSGVQNGSITPNCS